jgi:hypothetical protein
VEDGDVIIVWKPFIAGISGVAALELERISSSFEDENLSTAFGKPRGDRAAASAGTDHNVFEALAVDVAHDNFPLSAGIDPASIQTLKGSGVIDFKHAFSAARALAAHRLSVKL